MPTTLEPMSQTEFPRRYVAADAVFDRWETAQPYFEELAARPLRTVDEIERWLHDWSELDSCFDEEGTRRQIDMTRQTDDPQREAAFLHFIENVKPHREPWEHKLRQKLVEAADRVRLPGRYDVLIRSVRNAIEIYRDENIPLMIENERLSQQYQKITGIMTVEFRGQEMTLQQVGRFLEEPDRTTREEAWRLAADRFLKDGDELDALYDKMVHLRHRIATNAACADFQQYAFRMYERFDYTPGHCYAFHDAMEKVVVPAMMKLAEKRRQALGLTTLRPWDLAVDPENRPPLRPFTTDEELSAGCGRIFDRVDPELGAIFQTLRNNQVLDLGSRKGKAPGGYQATYPERRMPFIFMNAVGTEGDVRTLLHEGGHAFHTWACRHDPLLAYRNYPIEFAEVASMGMECLALPHLDLFYGPETNRARKRFLEEIVYSLPWIAMVDAFQHYVYTNVDHTPPRRNEEWVRIAQRFAPHADWTGLEPYRARAWHRKLHFFEVPFYYIEYGIAQLGALQVWLTSRKDYRKAVQMYRAGLALGGSRPLPELFETAGLKFDFSEKTVRPLIDAVMEEIENL